MDLIVFINTFSP